MLLIVMGIFRLIIYRGIDTSVLTKDINFAFRGKPRSVGWLWRYSLLIRSFPTCLTVAWQDTFVERTLHLQEVDFLDSAYNTKNKSWKQALYQMSNVYYNIYCYKRCLYLLVIQLHIQSLNYMLNPNHLR